MRWIGKDVPRKEGKDKVTGASRYIDDITFPDMLYGVTVRSETSRGILQRTVFEEGIPWEEFTQVTCKDIPGNNYVALIETDQPYLADGKINHPLEAVLLLAHPDKYLLQEARRKVSLEVDPLPPVYDIEESLNQKEIVWGKDNVFKEYLLEKGDIDQVWEKADHIIEGEYKTGAQEQLYIETNGIVAVANPEEGVTVWGSLQCPYYVHKALMALFDLPADKIRVIQTTTGGGFGGKEEYPSMIAGHAALLAWKSGKPVKLIYDRLEDLAATTKRHPSLTRHKMALSSEGKILGMEIDFVLDGGAYATLSSVVLSRGTIHAAGPYLCENVRVRARVVATNTPPHGAFRGFGAPQSIFALERHLDKAALQLNLSKEELRRRNFIQEGQLTATGQVINEKVSLADLMTKAMEKSDFQKKKEQFHSENKKNKYIKRGIGLSSFFHGAGFTGSGEAYLESMLGMEATKEGKIRILSASTEIGQGTNTIFSQIAAEALGIEYDLIEISVPDTALVPNSGPTVASRTCMIVGKLVESAAIQVKEILRQSGFLASTYSSSEFSKACQSYLDKFSQLRVFSKYKQPTNIKWDDQTYRGDAYGAYAWAVYVAEIKIDLRTYETTVEDFVALQEVGKVIHPTLAAGQIEGGVAQGIGYGLYEKVVWDKGQMINNQMTNYIMPTSADIGKIRVFFEEAPYAHGPAGAKGIGELPLDGVAPAISSAIENAIGLDIPEIPVTPETLHEYWVSRKVNS